MGEIAELVEKYIGEAKKKKVPKGVQIKKAKRSIFLAKKDLKATKSPLYASKLKARIKKKEELIKKIKGK